ncbi:MAG TPA: hypothetical protein VGK48_12220 [Terriglobia bacterium]|jgi:hypothetical protein
MFHLRAFSSRILLVLIAIPALPLLAQVSSVTIPTAPTPADPYELVTGAISALTEPADRVAAMNLIRTAAKNGISHNAEMNPFDYQVKFNATGNVADTGSGELTETWLSGQNWRVTISLGNYSMIRYGYSGKVGDQIPVSRLPMRAQMLRNEVLWAIGNVNGGVPAGVRVSNAALNGEPVTCVLLSGVNGAMAQTQSRLWLENEYCVSTSTGLLQVHSPVPGTYTVFGYSRKLQFHGKFMPDHFTTYVAGVQVITADMVVKDPALSSAQLRPPEAIPVGRGGVVLSEPARMQLNLPGSSNVMGTVVIRTAFNNQGQATDAEVSSASDRSLIDAAMSKAKHFEFHGSNEAYLTVRFSPQAE